MALTAQSQPPIRNLYLKDCELLKLINSYDLKIRALRSEQADFITFTFLQIKLPKHLWKNINQIFG